MVDGPGGISSLAFQPQQQIKFRPDPGEPAVRLSAPPSQTAGLVSAQEQRNEVRLRTQALLKGDDILFTKRTFTLGLGPNSPVFNAGLTTVVSREDANGFAPDTQIGPVSSQEELRASQESESEEEEEDRAIGEEEEGLSSLLQADEEDEEELESEETELQNEDQRLSRNLSLAQLEQQQALQTGNPVQIDETEREIKELERELEETEKEQKENEQKQLEIRLEEFQGETTDAIEGSLEAAFGLIGVLFGIGGEEEDDSSPASSPI